MDIAVRVVAISETKLNANLAVDHDEIASHYAREVVETNDTDLRSMVDSEVLHESTIRRLDCVIHVRHESSVDGMRSVILE